MLKHTFRAVALGAAILAAGLSSGPLIAIAQTYGSGSYSPSHPVYGLPANRVLCAGGTAASVTGTTSETTLATCTVPAGVMGANGIIRIQAFYSTTNSANVKTIRHRFGGLSGTMFGGVNLTTNSASSMDTIIFNRSAAASQIGRSFANRNIDLLLAVTASTHATSSLNTANAQDIVLSCALANSGETCTLESYVVELITP